ncbi:hypothetical protein OC845_005004 [Tilletia horrida]|nr:hypothetical protein OC845_005004 [Tilletia horrida]
MGVARDTTMLCALKVNAAVNTGPVSGCINDGPPPPPKGPKAPSVDLNSLYKPPPGTLDSRALVGYWSSWAQYRGADPHTPACKPADIHLPESINPFIYTHINYAFVFLSDTNFTIIPHEIDDEDLSLRMNQFLKGANPSIKTSFSIGGWTFTDGPSKFTGGIDYSRVFSNMAANGANRAAFINSCIAWARKLGFDGIDIDWEYVGDTARGGSPSDGANFLTLMQEMRAAFNNEGSASGRAPLLITIAAPADPDKVALFDVKAVSQYIDCTTAPVLDTFQPTWSYTSAINLYLNAGVDPQKINAGLPAYGRVWTLNDVSKNTPGSLGSAGVTGRCTGEPGYMGYFEIMEILNVFDSLGQAQSHYFYKPGDGAYMTFDDQWVGFDNDESVRDKVSIIKQKNLRGGMIWAVDLDTKDYAFTRSVIESFSGCPLDGLWPASPIGASASLPCQSRGNNLGNQLRTCQSGGVWSTVDLSGCRDLFALADLSATCV